MALLGIQGSFCRKQRDGERIRYKDYVKSRLLWLKSERKMQCFKNADICNENVTNFLKMITFLSQKEDIVEKKRKSSCKCGQSLLD